ncbi:MAG: SH3 domain-containing protein [Sulfitobacter sp.]
MKTFILLTFGFLGFAFYEMSGGADFVPASARMAAEQPDEIAPVVSTETAVEPVTTAAVTQIDSTPNVTRVALDLTNLDDAVTQATTPQVEASTATVTDSAETPQIILPSLIATTQTATDTSDDIRTVSGNRVNVRGGPSTNYGIVNKLTRGATVQILEDNGDGWVRMKPIDGGESGWMADFLLTSG